MNTCRRFCLIEALLATFLTCVAARGLAAARDEPQPAAAPLPRHAVPGTPMTIDVPPGFEPSSSFAGLIEPASSTSILVMGLPDYVGEAVAGTDWRRDLEERGMRVLEIEEVATDGHPGVLIRASQPTVPGRVASECWFRVLGDDDSTWMIVAKTPTEGSAKRLAVIRAAVMSARLDGSRSNDPFEGMPFRLRGLGGMQILSRLPSGIVLMVDGEPDREGVGKAAYSATPVEATFPSEVFDVAMLVEMQMRVMSRISEVGDVAVTAIEVDGLKGAEATAQGVDPRSGTRITCVLALLLDGATAWRFEGSVAAEKAEDWIPVFRGLTRGFERRRQTFEAPSGAYRLTAPGGWSRLRTEDPDVEMQIGHAHAACYVACHSDAETAPAQTPLAEYGPLIRDFYLQGEVTLEETNDTDLGGRPAVRYVLHRKAESLAQVITIVEGGGAYRHVNAWAPDWAFERDPACLYEVIESFEVSEGDD